MSRRSDYSNKDLNAALARLRARGLNPDTISLACALGLHADCPGILDAVRRRGDPSNRCCCPDCDDHAGRFTRPRARHTAT